MTSFKKAVSSIIAVFAVCGALTVGAFANTIDTYIPTSTNATSISYNFDKVYQEYMLFSTDSTTRTASSAKFTTKVTTFSGPKYSASAAVYAPASSAGAYSYSASISGTGTFSANYIYSSSGSTESRPVVMGISFDSRETPGSTFKIAGTFYPNGN